MTAISVIIPTWNRAPLVPLAIESVLNQTHPAAEIIVVDDGSTDNTAEILRPYVDRVRVIRQSNSGVSSARNAGIKAATSEWVSFLDDDDEYATDRLAIAVEGIRRFPAANVHASNMGIFTPGKKPIDLFKLRGLNASEWMPLDRPLLSALKGCYFVQSLVVKRHVVNEVGAFRNMLFEDLDLVVRLTQRSPWIVDSRHSVKLMRRDASMPNLSADWRSKPIQRAEALVQIHQSALAYPDLSRNESRVVRTGLASNLFELGVAVADAGDTAAARARFIRAAITFPAYHSKIKSAAAALGGRAALLALRSIAKPQKTAVR